MKWYTVAIACLAAGVIAGCAPSHHPDPASDPEQPVEASDQVSIAVEPVVPDSPVVTIAGYSDSDYLKNSTITFTGTADPIIVKAQLTLDQRSP